MKFNDRAMALLGVPDLPIRAFVRKAGGGIIPQGGGSAPSSTSTSTTALPEWALGYAQDTLAKQSALSDRPYEAYNAPRIAGFTPMQEQARQSAAGMSAGPEAFSQGIGAYMSPYIQNVVDIQKREARRQSDIDAQNIGAKAAQLGAFGSRTDLLNSENRRNLQQQMGDIQARGTQAAYDQAANQFRQGITQGMDINRLQSAYGTQQQAMNQSGLTQAYQDWQAQRDYPQQQLSNMSSMIRGLPIGTTTSAYQTGTTGSPSFLQTLGSLGTAAYGLKQFFADGGSVDSQQNVENIVHKLLDPALDQAEQAAKDRGDAVQLKAIQDEKAARASMRRGLGAMPVDMDQMLPTEESMARGGIVAFNGGGWGKSGDADGGGWGKSGDADEDVGPDVSTGDDDSEGVDDKAAYKTALDAQLKQADAIANAKYNSISPDAYNKAIEDRYAMLQKMAGASPYEGMRQDVKRMSDEGAGNLKQAKGLAALKAASAMLQGNNAIRGLAAGATSFGESYGEAVKADQAQKRALQNMQINIADAERKEKMGFTKDAIAAADQARKDHHDAQQYAIQKSQALANINRGIAATVKAGTTKPPPEPKVAELAVKSAVETRMSREKPKPGETPEMMKARITSEETNRVLSLQQAKFVTADYGKARSELEEDKRTAAAVKNANDAADKKIKELLYSDPSYRKLPPEEKAAKDLEIRNKARADFGLPPSGPSAPPPPPPAVAPARTPSPPAVAPSKGKTVPANQAPAGMTTGKYVPGKGTEAIKDGKVVGYFN